RNRGQRAASAGRAAALLSPGEGAGSAPCGRLIPLAHQKPYLFFFFSFFSVWFFFFSPAMWSGLFTHLTESWNNCKDLDPDYVTRIDMGKHGYPTQKLGKSEYTSGLHSVSNRVEAWTRDFDFLLQQEGRRVINLTGDKTHVKVMEAAWQNTDKAINWIKEEAINLTQPFVLHLGLYLPQPYLSPYVGENFGSSTFLTSPYWLEKVCEVIKIPKWSSVSEMHPVDCYSSYRKNCTGEFTKQGVRNTRAFYYAMCAETDAMLGRVEPGHQEVGTPPHQAVPWQPGVRSYVSMSSLAVRFLSAHLRMLIEKENIEFFVKSKSWTFASYLLVVCE
uniref:Uncharacterized protein n=1 Tax=Calidris pygmaea TaxID=425635 RepID=A0A8C3JRP3_9CHAR